QRGRVVLPAATDDRHERRRPDEGERRRRLPRTAAHAHPPGEPAPLRDLDGARNFIRLSRTTRRQSMLVNRNPLMSHLDPLTAAPRTNAFLKTVVPFLDRKVFEQKRK